MAKVHINNLSRVLVGVIAGLLIAIFIGFIAWLIKSESLVFLLTAFMTEVLIVRSCIRWYNRDILDFRTSAVIIKGLHLPKPLEIRYEDLVGVEKGPHYIGIRLYDMGHKYILKTKQGDIIIWSTFLYRHIDKLKQRIPKTI